MKRQLLPIYRTLAACLYALLLTVSAGAEPTDLSTARKRELMAGIKRIAVVPPFFATDTQSRAEGGRKDDAPNARRPGKPADNIATDARLADYAAKLRKLTEHAATRLPQRISVRTPYAVIPAADIAAAFKDLEWTPESLFHDGGRLHGTRYPLPDADAVKKLASRLHVDAVLLTVLDEPRRNSGHYFFDPLAGIDYRPAQVQSRACFYLLTPDAVEIVRDAVDAVHPLTHIGNREYLLVDWIETQDVLYEDLLDELGRYMPAK